MIDHLTEIRDDRIHDSIRFPGLAAAWIAPDEHGEPAVWGLDHDPSHLIPEPGIYAHQRDTHPAVWAALVEILHDHTPPPWLTSRAVEK